MFEFSTAESLPPSGPAFVPFREDSGFPSVVDARRVRGIVEEIHPARRTVIQGTDNAGRVIMLAATREPAAELAAKVNQAHTALRDSTAVAERSAAAELADRVAQLEATLTALRQSPALASITSA